MRLSTMMKLVSGVLVLLLSLTVLLNYLLYLSDQAEEEALANRKEFKQLGVELANASDYLTNEARQYAVTGEKEHYDNYWREVNETKTRDRVVARLKELNAPQAELDLIEKAKQAEEDSDALVKMEDAAMKAVADKDFETARKLMFDKQYEANKKMIMEPILTFQKGDDRPRGTRGGGGSREDSLDDQVGHDCHWYRHADDIGDFLHTEQTHETVERLDFSGEPHCEW